MSIGIWIKAARLKTLPLAIAGTITGNLMSMTENVNINKTTFLLSVLTAVFLQILSNYANDYGDFKNGADTKERTDRMMASGLITEQKMKIAITLLIILVLMLGISLLVYNFGLFSFPFLGMFLLGISGILAAYFYTAGKNPYGYRGLGDLAVFVFFGFIAVIGTYFLQTRSINSNIWMVASAVGCLSVAVLNINNIRDIDSDRSKNKITIPVSIGYYKSIIYHASLLILALTLFGLYTFIEFIHPLQLFFLILTPLFIKHFYGLINALKIGRSAYNQQLKTLSLLTFAICMVFCFGQLFIKLSWD